MELKAERMTKKQYCQLIHEHCANCNKLILPGYDVPFKIVDGRIVCSEKCMRQLEWIVEKPAEKQDSLQYSKETSIQQPVKSVNCRESTCTRLFSSNEAEAQHYKDMHIKKRKKHGFGGHYIKPLTEEDRRDELRRIERWKRVGRF